MVRILTKAVTFLPFSAAIVNPIAARVENPAPNVQHLKEIDYFLGSWIHQGKTVTGEDLIVNKKVAWALDISYLMVLTKIIGNGELLMARRVIPDSAWRLARVPK
jgi:hypothetical protein